MPSLSGLFLLLILYLLILSASRFLLDSDTGWHIRAGDVMRATHTVLRHDVFSHTMAGREWFAWEWLADVLMSLVHSRRSLAGVVGGAIALLFVSYAGLYRLMLARGADTMLAGTLVLYAALASVVHWLARPHLFSIVLMVVWCAAVEDYRRHRSKLIYALPLVYGLWANLHGAFVVTFPLFAIYAGGEALEYAFRRRTAQTTSDENSSTDKGGPRAALKVYVLVALTSFTASLATPFGLRLYGHLWQYLTDNKLLALIHEFQSPSFHTLDGKLIEGLLLLSVAALLEAVRQRRFVDAGLLLFWAHLVLQAERHVTLAVIVVTPIIAEHLTTLSAEASALIASHQDRAGKLWRAVRDWYRGILAIDRQLTGVTIYAGTLVFLAALIFSATGRGTWADRRLPAEFDSRRFPAGSVAFVAASQADPASPFHRQLNGRLFAGDQYGGYVIYRLYPRVKVFIDGRSDFYRQGRVLDDALAVLQLKPEVTELLDRYEVQWLLVRRDEPLAAWARARTDWQSAYRDETAEVFVRKE